MGLRRGKGRKGKKSRQLAKGNEGGGGEVKIGKRSRDRETSAQGKTKEMNLVGNRKVELRGHVKAKILPAVHRKR